MALPFKKTLAFVVLACAIFFVVTGIVRFPAQTNADRLRATGAETTIRVGGALISAEIAETPEKRALGLSGRKTLGKNEGMLFVFDEPGIYSFWMKDMLFPIDIIWLDEGFRVVAIAENAAPSSFPNLFTPSSPAQYVLEVPSGFVRQHTTRVGEYVHIR